MASFNHQDSVRRAAFSPTVLRSDGDADNTAKLWDTASGKLILRPFIRAWLTLRRLSPDGARILTASADTNAKLWDAASRQVDHLL